MLNTTSSTTSSVFGRFISIQQQREEYINISGLEIYDNNNDKILFNSNDITINPNYSSTEFPNYNLIDNNPDTFVHTQNVKYAFIRIDLKTNRNISRIVIINRKNFENRLVGSILTISNNSGKLLYYTPITTANPQYVIIPGKPISVINTYPSKIITENKYIVLATSPIIMPTTSSYRMQAPLPMQTPLPMQAPLPMQTPLPMQAPVPNQYMMPTTSSNRMQALVQIQAPVQMQAPIQPNIQAPIQQINIIPNPMLFPTTRPNPMLFPTTRPNPMLFPTTRPNTQPMLMPTIDYIYDSYATFDNSVNLIKKDYSLWVWGSNNTNKLGLNNTNSKIINPTQVAIPNKWIYVTSNSFNTLAIDNNNDLYIAGSGNVGSMGSRILGALVSNVNLVLTRANISLKIKYITCNDYSYSFIDINDNLYFGGSNSYGLCANNNIGITSITTPTQEYSNSKWKYIAIGGTYSVGIKTDGTLWSIGNNHYGQLGNNSKINSSTWVQENTLANNWNKVIILNNNSELTASATTIALTNSGKIYTWGSNNNGLLGIKNLDNRITQLTPILINETNLVNTSSTSTNKWISIAGNSTHVLALRSDGSVYAWGYNINGQLGKNNIINSLAPFPISSLNTPNNNYISIAVSGMTSFAVKNNGYLFGWGSNSFNEISSIDTTNKLIPTFITSVF